MRKRAAKITPAKFATVIREFKETDQFKGYSESTRSIWGRDLLNAESPEHLGDILNTDIRPALVQAFLDKLAKTPGKQETTYKALKQLDAWAGRLDKLPRQITFGLKVKGPQGGHKPWEPHEIELAVKHATPSLVRAIWLAYGTGQRASDLVRMQGHHVQILQGRVGIRVVQKKTTRALWVPFPAELLKVYGTWERRLPDYLLLTERGRPYTRASLKDAWRHERESNPHLAPLENRDLRIHGLRGSRCVAYAQEGLTDHQIGDVIGMSPAMVSRYTRFSKQENNALAAMAFLEKNRR